MVTLPSIWLAAFRRPPLSTEWLVVIDFFHSFAPASAAYSVHVIDNTEMQE
jgi:hypothetical protein